MSMTVKGKEIVMYFLYLCILYFLSLFICFTTLKCLLPLPCCHSPLKKRDQQEMDTCLCPFKEGEMWKNLLLIQVGKRGLNHISSPSIFPMLTEASGYPRSFFTDGQRSVISITSTMTLRRRVLILITKRTRRRCEIQPGDFLIGSCWLLYFTG